MKKRLIEHDLPLATISAESAREKNILHGHPSTLHIWWGCRPPADRGGRLDAGDAAAGFVSGEGD